MISFQLLTNPTQILTFQEYLLYQADSDIIYELFWGRLIPLPTPTARPSSICTFLVYQLQQYIADQNEVLISELSGNFLRDMILLNS